jgi:alpha-beta hydrolase superfamily lysophospholipase
MGSRPFTSCTTELGQRFVRRCAPASGLADRSLILVHGAGEHSGRYSHLVPQIVARGWNLIAGDLSGHGLSGGTATHLDDFEQYLADVEAMYRHYQLVPERTALLGHSMGGLVSARFVQTRAHSVAALVLCAPLLAFGMEVPFARRMLGRLCLAVAPRTRFQTRVPIEDVTRNEEARQRRLEDPLTNRTVTAGWYFSVLRALQQVADDASRLQTPLLLMQGVADRIVRPDAANRWFAQAGSADKSLWLFRDDLHELLNEPDWERTLGVMLDWLDARIPILGSHSVSTETASRIETPELAAS